MSVQDIYDAVLNYNRLGMASLTEDELKAGTPVMEILNQGLIAPMDEVGRKFAERSLFLPEMMMAAQTMKEGMQVLKPLLVGETIPRAGVIVVGTVKGDMHDIGKNLVVMMLEGGGFQVHDLGVDVPKEKFVEEGRRHSAGIVALSSLLTTTMPAMEEATTAIKSELKRVKVIVGGAPVTEQFAKQIGADGYAQDAPAAVALVRRLITA